MGDVGVGYPRSLVCAETMNSVLVTGAGGFIGQRVLKVADEDEYDVIPIARKPMSGRSIVLDLRDPLEALPNVNWVFHLAGGYAGADSQTLRGSDLEIAKRLTDWGRRKGIKNWVFASAAEVYGRCEEPATEDSTARPVIAYGRVKLQIERMLTQLADELPGSRVVILRIGEVYGREGTLIDELTRRFHAGFCPWFGSGDVPVSFVHVDDVARSFWAAARVAPAGASIWNVADDAPSRWREFLDYLADLLGKRRAIGLPLPVARLYAAASSAADRVRGHPPTVTQDVVTLLTTAKPLSNRKARDAFGIDLRYPDYQSGLRQVVGG